MKETQTTVAPGAFKPRNVLLASLHVLVIAVSLWVHPVYETGVVTALP